MGIVEIVELLRKTRQQYTGLARDRIEEAIDKLYLAIFESSQDEIFDEIKNNIWNLVKDSKIKSSQALNNEICLTSLVEDICNNWEVNFENGPLDESSHWVWSDAYKALEEVGETLDDENSNN